jgi:hypothetical protein
MTKTRPQRVELRGLCNPELATALDAIAMSRGMDRNTYVVEVLERDVRRVLHEASVINRALRGNPLLEEVVGTNQ